MEENQKELPASTPKMSSVPSAPVASTASGVSASAEPLASTPQKQAFPRLWREVRKYSLALAVTIPLFVLFSAYIYYRGGFYDLYIANKIFAGLSAALLGIVLLIGPLARSFPQHRKYIQYRKELGILSFFLALAHGIASFFFLPEHFSRERFFTTGLWPFIFGLAATVLVTVIFAISNQRAMFALGTKVWWLIQSWGVRATFILVGLHVGVMKYKDWIEWYQQGGASTLVHPEWPGLGLLIAWFMGFVMLVRIADVLNNELRKAALYALGIGIPAAYVFSFLWGLQF